MMASLHKSKQFFFVLIKLSIVLLAFYFIYVRLAHNESLELTNFINLFKGNSKFSLNIVWALIALSLLNWFLEILKWQMLTRHIKKLPLIEAMKQSLSSLTSSIFTPNRIGEYGAKALYFQAELRKKIVFMNFIGQMMQLAVTVIFGVIGLYYFIKIYESPIRLKNSFNIITISIMASCLLVCILLINRHHLILRSANYLRLLPKGICFKAFLYSTMRYIIFSFQFYFLLRILGVELSYLNSMIFISSLYLVTSIIPNIVLLDVVVKGGAAIFLFSFANVDELTSLYVITIMWILNVVIPSIWGSYYVLNYKHKNAIIEV